MQKFKMTRRLLISALAGLFTLTAMAQDAADASKPRVVFTTNMGIIEMELYREQAPNTVDNFLRYVADGHYEGTTFHRVISHFMIQGGGLTSDLQKKPTREPIENEADNGLKNLRGTVAMARTNDPHSATSQFYINVEANPALDHRGKTDSRAWGYTVFGHVIDGMDVVDNIRFVETNARDVPLEPVIIESAELR